MKFFVKNSKRKKINKKEEWKVVFLAFFFYEMIQRKTVLRCDVKRERTEGLIGREIKID